MMLHEIKIVDLNHSEWDKKLSNPESGKYHFVKKTYIDYHGGKGIRPEHHLLWVSKTPREIMTWKTRYGYTLVEFGIDPYWPEDIAPNEEGHFVFSDDVVLMKCSLLEYLKRKEKDQEIMRRQQGRSMIQGLQEEINRTGMGLPDNWMDKALEKFRP